MSLQKFKGFLASAKRIFALEAQAKCLLSASFYVNITQREQLFAKRSLGKQIFGVERIIYHGNYITVMKIVDDGTAKLVMHPVRFNILHCLSEASEPLFVEQIAKAVKEHPRLVSHHLNILQEIGLVDCKYKIAKAKGSKRGVAVRLCSPTPKLAQVLRDIAMAVTEVK